MVRYADSGGDRESDADTERNMRRTRGWELEVGKNEK